MRRVGDRAGRPGGGNRGRRVVVPINGELLLEIEGIAAGGVSPRSPSLSHEANQSQGRGPGLGAHHVGRGVFDHGREVQRCQRALRRGIAVRHAGNEPRVEHGRRHGVSPAVQHAEQHRGVRDLQGSAPHGDHDDQRDGFFLAGHRRASPGVCAVGRRVGDFQLRRFRAHDGRCREIG